MHVRTEILRVFSGIIIEIGLECRNVTMEEVQKKFEMSSQDLVLHTYYYYRWCHLSSFMNHALEQDKTPRKNNLTDDVLVEVIPP